MLQPAILVCLLLSISLSHGAQPGLVKSEFIFESAPFPSCHAATIEETSEGLIAAYFGGTAERNPDVCIYVSRHVGGKWQPPVEVADGLGFGTNRLPTWNPVLFQPKTGPLMLFYKVGPSPSTWWGMVKYSTDAGKTWTAPRRLPDGVLGPVKNKPVQLPNGDVLSPSSTEGDGGWRVHFERSRDGGINWTTLPPVNEGKKIHAIQPSLLLHPGGRLQSIGRTREGRMFEIWSEDGGETWGPLTLTELPNPNSGTDAVTLQDGRHLLVYNHNPLNKGRKPLNVSLSKDGKSWSGALVIEDDFSKRDGYAYPAVIQSRDGLVHIVYTWDRKRIKHVVVDPSKVELRPIVNGAWAGEKNSIGIEMAAIPSGSFLMGDVKGDWDERTTNMVTISKPFKMAMDEVTLEQFKQFRPHHEGAFNGKVTGVSWHDAVAFCEWLTKKEGKIYRLPTEAEWEFACRAGGTNGHRFWAGATRPADTAPNPWNLRSLHDDVMEWCADWHAPYTHGAKVDPVGPATGMCKVVRGDKPDNSSRLKDEPGRTAEDYHRSANRAGLPPGFGIMTGNGASTAVKSQPGLIGMRFGDDIFKRATDVMVLDKMQNNWGRTHGIEWSARWIGQIEAPTTGVVLLAPITANGVRITIGGKLVCDTIANSTEASGQFTAQKGEKLPVLVEFAARGDAGLELHWAWGTVRERVPDSALSHSDAEARAMTDNAGDGDVANFGVLDRPGFHRVGFRVVQVEMPVLGVPASAGFSTSRETPARLKAGLQAVPTQPYFRKRHLLPMPSDNATPEAIVAAGFPESFRKHNHSPALEVCPNGDVLLIIYTSNFEYEPGVSLMSSRLRAGADDWDFPEPMFDTPDVNDHAPLLFTDWARGGRMYFFWGWPKLTTGAYPFQWMTSEDSGVTWSEVKFPRFTTPIGPHARQPINTALRAKNGIFYVASDAEKTNSVLWVSKDDGKTWQDTGGRSAGRHTTFALLKNGDILGMGGKTTDIDGYMPKAVSRNGGKTWAVSKTPFPAQGVNQRPSLLRLKSGRLLFSGDFQRRGNIAPEGVTNRGCYIAISDDEGATWRIKKLPGTQPHEKPEYQKDPDTLGYSAMRQAPDGMIHLVSTMNTPCLHFEFNEAWVMSDEVLGETESAARERSEARVHVRTQHWENGAKKSESSWRGFKADGPARRWDRDGNLVSEVEFKDGFLR